MTYAPHGIFALLLDGLPVAPSQTTESRESTRGWTLRPSRLSPTAMRFDWLHGRVTGSQTAHQGDASEREALRRDVMAAAARIATQNGYAVKADGTGLIIAAQSHSLL